MQSDKADNPVWLLWLRLGNNGIIKSVTFPNNESEVQFFLATDGKIPHDSGVSNGIEVTPT